MFRTLFWLAICVLVMIPLACSIPFWQRSSSRADQINRDVLFLNFYSDCHSNSNQLPSLIGIYGEERTLENGETVKIDDTYLRESILYPDAKIVKGYKPIMPSYEPHLNDEELDALIEYMRSLDRCCIDQEGTTPDHRHPLVQVMASTNRFNNRVYSTSDFAVGVND